MAQTSVDALGVGACRGIVLSGDGKYAWISNTTGDDFVSGNGSVAFYDLNPFGGTPANLSAPRRNGYPIYIQAVVTAPYLKSTEPAEQGFFVENQERTMGSRVIWNGATPANGKLVTLKVGASTSVSGEKVLTAINSTDAVVVGATASPAVKPLVVTNKTMGRVTNGLANDGMLVKVCGKVTGYNADTFEFYIDDGSGVPSGIESPSKGVRVARADGGDVSTAINFETLVYTNEPCYAIVTGIVRLDKIGNNIVRRIDARSLADIVISAL